MTRSLGLEWGTYNIRVVGIAPGPIKDTPGTTKLAPGMSGEEVNELIGSANKGFLQKLRTITFYEQLSKNGQNLN